MTAHLTVVDHPLVQHKLTLMRDVGTPTAVFRQLLREISTLLAYEVTRNLAITTREIETPLTRMDAPVLDGRKLALDIMRPGAVLGEITLFDPGPRTATATALEPSCLRRVRNSDVLAEIRKSPDLAIDLIHLAGQRMRYMNRQLNEQVFLPVPLRLARKVLYLIQSCPDNSPDCATLALSQSELAEFIGATREAVSKTLSVWKKSGVIEATRGGLVVHDRRALEVIAAPDSI